MQFDELLYQGEANAGPLIGASQSSFDAMEPLKQVRQLLRGNSHSVIADFQLHRAVNWLNAHLDGPLDSGLETVRVEIGDNIFPHVEVNRNPLIDRLSSLFIPCH